MESEAETKVPSTTRPVGRVVRRYPVYPARVHLMYLLHVTGATRAGRAGQERALPPWEGPSRPSTPRLWLVVLGLVLDSPRTRPRLVQ